MKKGFRKMTYLMVFLLVGALLFTPFLRMTSSAASLGESYLFLERMQINTETDMILMFTPSSNFTEAANERELRILFPETQGAWCQAAAGSLTVAGVASSPVDSGARSIDAALPNFDEETNTLEATCHQGGAGENDYIKIINIGDLTAGQSYGVKLDKNAASFKTGSNTGSNLISLQLQEDTKTETISFEINLTALAGDQLVVSATVNESESITCGVGSDVNIGTLYKGGAYTTADHTLTVNSGTPYYWAVYGDEGGLRHATDATATGLLSSAGVGGTVDLIGGFGFGMVVSTAGTGGSIEANYVSTTPGQFGAVGVGFDNANLFLTGTTADTSHTLTLGARAAIDSADGSYSETLTYICGGYIGE